MLLDAMGIILAYNHRVNLGELTEERALAAVPFGGRYRLIDIMLSSMVNSGVKNIGILAETKYNSLMDHIGTGSHWDLDRLQQGLRIIPPYISSDFFRSANPQDLNGLYDFLKHSLQRYVVVSEGNIVGNLYFSDFINTHIEGDADMTVMYNDDGDEYGSPSVCLDFKDGLLSDFMIDAKRPPTKHSSLGIVILQKDLLLDILSQEIARGGTQFSVEYLLRKFNEYKIRGFKYEDLVMRINSLSSYYSCSMKLLDRDILRKVFKSDRKIYTKVKNEDPARYFKGNSVKNSLISDGCDIAGEIDSSIIFRGVSIGRNSKIRNCIIMQDTQVMDGAELDNVIIDKDSIIRSGVRLHGSPDYPVVIGKGVIV